MVIGTTRASWQTENRRVGSTIGRGGVAQYGSPDHHGVKGTFAWELFGAKGKSNKAANVVSVIVLPI